MLKKINKLFLLFLLFSIFFIPPSFAADTQVRLIIFPFQNLTQNKADDWIGNGFSETLTASLATLQNLVVIERSQLKNILKEQMIAQSGYIDQNTAVEAGKILSANIVVVGNFQKMNDQIRVTARFVDVKTGEVQKDHIADIRGKTEDIFDLQSQLADKIIQSFAVKVSQAESQKLTTAIHSTKSLEAYEYYIKGKELVNQMSLRSLNQAMESLKKAVVTDPNYAIAHAYLSIVYSTLSEQYTGLGDIKASECKPLASSHANKSLALAPDLPEAHRAMAYVYFNDKRNQDAENEIKTAMKLNPKDTESVIFYLNKVTLGDFMDKLEEFEKILSSDNDNPLLLLNIGAIYMLKSIECQALEDIKGREDNLNQAISYFEKVLKKFPQNYIAHFMMAQTYAMLKKTDISDQYIQKMFSLDPDSFFPYFHAGCIYMESGRYPEAETVFKKALELNPDNNYIYVTLGNTYRMQQKNDLAFDILTKGVKRNPNDQYSYFSLGIIKLTSESTEETENIFNEGLKYNPESYVLHKALGEIYFIKADKKPEFYEKAIKEFHISINILEKGDTIKDVRFINMNKSYIYCSIAKAYRNQNKIDDSINELNKAKKSYPKNPEIYKELADIYINTGKYEEIIPNLEKVVEISPKDPNEYYNLASALLRLKKFDKAEIAFKKAIELKPDYVKAHYNLGVVYWQLGKYKEAGDCWENTLKLDPAHQNAKEWLLKAKEKLKN